jgi:hypothetical protein
MVNLTKDRLGPVIDGLHTGQVNGFPSAGETAGVKITAKSRTKALKKSSLNTFMSVWR